MEEIFVNKVATDIGDLFLASTCTGLAVISFGKNGQAYFDSIIEHDFKNHEIIIGGGFNKSAEKQIKEYLRGKRKIFDIPLDLKGSPFQIKTYLRVIEIPYGQVETYGSIAELIGHPRASRAVGTAMAKCRMPLVIPCHRVVASGGLGGYAGEESLKRRLLKMEGISIK
ncbi:MAG: methylated-DNA--[protein]-cysteine S-methyltransferase [Candidatus Zixiibacteriota bacterium]